MANDKTRTANQLTQKQSYLLCQHLLAEADGIRERRPSQARVAKTAADALGFQVTRWNLAAALAIVELEWVPARGQKVSGRSPGRIVQLEAEVVRITSLLIDQDDSLRRLDKRLDLVCSSYNEQLSNIRKHIDALERRIAALEGAIIAPGPVAATYQADLARLAAFSGNDTGAK